MTTTQESFLTEFAKRFEALEPEQRDELAGILAAMPERELDGLRADLRLRERELVAAS